MLSKKEITKSVHVINVNKPASSQNHKTEYFDKDGKVISNKDESLVWAFKTFNKGTYDCYVKANCFGAIWSNEKGIENTYKQQASIMGVKEHQMIRVPKEAFDNYILYLQNKKEHYLKLAEREI